MSDCEGCASKEAQIVFLANRAAIYSEALRVIENIVDDNRADEVSESIMDVIEDSILNSYRTGKHTGLRVELDGKVLIEPEEKPGVHDHRDEWEKGHPREVA